MIEMFTLNFIIFGRIPTPNVTCNVTWDPFQEHNLTYLILDYHKHLWFRYRQSHYGFWESYFPSIAKQDYCKYYSVYQGLSCPCQCIIQSDFTIIFVEHYNIDDK